MDPGTVVLFLALLAATLAFVGWPLARPILAAEGPSGREDRRQALEEEKERFLSALRDLEHDRQTGKIAPEDYQALTDKLRIEAARVLKEIDVNEGRKVKRPGEKPEPSPEVARLESALGTLASRPPDPARLEEAKQVLEGLYQTATKQREVALPATPITPGPSAAASAPAAGRFCTKCGWRAKAGDDRFCGKCGAALPQD